LKECREPKAKGGNFGEPANMGKAVLADLWGASLEATNGGKAATGERMTSKKFQVKTWQSQP